MRTLKQMEFSRWNGAKSRGPRSSEGKKISSQNSFKTGLYSKSLVTLGEKLEDFETLRDEYYQHHSPQTPEEREALDIIIGLAWQIRRYAMAETHLWNLDINRAEINVPADLLDGCLFGSAFFASDQKFARLHRMQAAAQRQFREALHELERLQASRASGSIEAEPIEDAITSPPLGFVPSNCGDEASAGFSGMPPGFCPAQSGKPEDPSILAPPLTSPDPGFVPSTLSDSPAPHSNPDGVGTDASCFPSQPSLPWERSHTASHSDRARSN